MADSAAIRATLTTGEPTADSAPSTQFAGRQRMITPMLSAQMLLEGLDAIAALKQKSLADRDSAERISVCALLRRARDECAAGSRSTASSTAKITIDRILLDRLFSPAARRSNVPLSSLHYSASKFNAEGASNRVHAFIWRAPEKTTSLRVRAHSQVRPRGFSRLAQNHCKRKIHPFDRGLDADSSLAGVASGLPLDRGALAG